MSGNLSFTLVIAAMLSSIIFSGTAIAGAKDSTAALPVGGTKEMTTYKAKQVKIGQYKAVFLESAAVDTKVEKTQKVTEFLNELKGIINATIEKSLRDTGRFQSVTSTKSQMPTSAGHLVCKSDSVIIFTNFDKARFMPGYGDGKSRIIMVLSIEDAQSGEILLKYTGWGTLYDDFGQSTIDKLRVDIADISGYFASLIKGLPD
ncbi:MAG: hypothetical protein HQK97_01660 [Nitrospirae bacterium]|nr:hypothetical protein [Nitrospirota bacterium]